MVWTLRYIALKQRLRRPGVYTGIGQDPCSIQDPLRGQALISFRSSCLRPSLLYLPSASSNYPPVFTNATSLEAFPERPFQLLSSSTLLVPIRQLAFAHLLLLTKSSTTQPVLPSLIYQNLQPFSTSGHNNGKSNMLEE